MNRLEIMQLIDKTIDRTCNDIKTNIDDPAGGMDIDYEELYHQIQVIIGATTLFMTLARIPSPTTGAPGVSTNAPN